jgi:hypothetical protein
MTVVIKQKLTNHELQSWMTTWKQQTFNMIPTFLRNAYEQF